MIWSGPVTACMSSILPRSRWTFAATRHPRHSCSASWRRGIIFHLGTTTQQVERVGEGFRITLANGETVAADVVLSAVGLRPRNTLAEAAGIKSIAGIVVMLPCRPVTRMFTPG